MYIECLSLKPTAALNEKKGQMFKMVVELSGVQFVVSHEYGYRPESDDRKSHDQLVISITFSEVYCQECD